VGGTRATMSIEPTIRRATSEEAEACHEILWGSVTDFGARHGTPLDGTAADWWASGEPVHRFLAAHAAEWWVAVEPDGSLVGYARSIERGGLFELIQRDESPEYGSARYQVGFTVEDIRAARAELVRRGVTPLSEIEGEESGSPNLWCYFRDPEGNVFEITEWRESSGA